MAKAKRQPQRPQPKRPASNGAGGAPASGASQARQPGAVTPAKPAPPKSAPAAKPNPSISARSSSTAGGAAGSSRLAAIRQAAGTGGSRGSAQGGARGGSAARRPQVNRYAAPPWWRRNLFTLGTVGVVVILIVAFIIFAQIQNQKASVGIGDPAPASVIHDATHVSPTVFAKVGAGTALKVFQATPKGTAPLTANGKPEIVYIGAEWCPFCAATRWSTVVALSRFGSFSGLTLMRSSSTDTFPNTATFSFRNTTYTSQYIIFSPTEDADRNGARLATPGTSAAHALATYDIPPYTTQAGGVPFMSYGNQYVTTSGLYEPKMLQGLTWQQIASDLNDPNSDVAQAIVGGANLQTAAICKLTNNQPGNVCGTPVIQQLEATLPQAK
ncbi:MAG TPA: DUF929 family protein [Ktedonobacterales bacterium]|nr:DUF929 family protein [Ktedonobacterales bacterium]